MFFKRSQPSDALARASNGEVTSVAARAQPLEASELRRVVNPATLGFKTTDELHPITGLIGQERALKAIQFGANIKSHDFNMFVLGPPASGKSTAVKAHLGPKAAEVADAVRLGLRLQFRESQPAQGAAAAAWPRPGARQGHGRVDRRAAERAAGAVRGRRLPGAAARHRRAVPLRPRGGARGAEQEGAGPEHRHPAHARPASPWRRCTRARSSSPRCSTRCRRACGGTSNPRSRPCRRSSSAILERLPKTDKQRRARLKELNEEVAKAAIIEALDDLVAAFTDVPAAVDYLECRRPRSRFATSACS